MSELKIGDIVVLTAGSMRMAVESINKQKVSTVWCNEGVMALNGMFDAPTTSQLIQIGSPKGDRSEGF